MSSSETGLTSLSAGRTSLEESKSDNRIQEGRRRRSTGRSSSETNFTSLSAGSVIVTLNWWQGFFWSFSSSGLIAHPGLVGELQTKQLQRKRSNEGTLGS